jgi:rhamnulose-1-phosphate aldolase
VATPHHGIFGVGADLDETFGLIETVKKQLLFIHKLERKAVK